jgi:hypothetical protein
MAARQGEVKTYTWVSGSATSPTIVTDGYSMFGLITPATWEMTTVKEQIDDGSGVWVDLFDKTGTAITTVLAASRATDLPGELSSFPRFRFSVTVGGNPAADRVFKVWARN